MANGAVKVNAMVYIDPLISSYLLESVRLYKQSYQQL